MADRMFDDLAACLEYPDSHTSARAIEAADAVDARWSGDPASAVLRDLAAWLKSERRGAPEERYTEVFDLKPICTPNLGYHLFGDTYQRGAFLAELASELNDVGVEHHKDLPDFLPTLLRLLGRLVDPEDRRLLVHAVLVPGLEAVVHALKESPGPWPDLLRALPGLLMNEVPKGDEEIPVPRKPLEVLQSV